MFISNSNIILNIYSEYPVSEDGSMVYSEVRTFMDKNPAVTNPYRSITTLGNKTISLTGNHPLYARKSSTEKFIVM